MNRFYFYEQTKRVGPINSTQLRRLALSGLITRETIIETDTGRQVKACRVYGLVFQSDSQRVKSVALPHGIPITPSSQSAPLVSKNSITFPVSENPIPLYPSQNRNESLSDISPVQEKTGKSFVFHRKNSRSIFDTTPVQTGGEIAGKFAVISPESDSSG